jgi:hypothetical protein
MLKFIAVELKMSNKDFCFAEETRFNSGLIPLQ